jgi:phosphoribosylamine--glycine ligase
MKKILVIGSGGREHAICKKFQESKQEKKIYCLPGNAGIAEFAEIVDVKQDDFPKIINFCQSEKIDFVFVGPEQPLVDGIVDELEKNNIAVFGPRKAASRLEGSKVFMKNIVAKNNVPTAKYQSFKDAKNAFEFAQTLGFPCVIKTDGLAAGKGVLIPQNKEECEISLNEIFAGKFGSAGNEVIVEEFLDGFEASYFVLCDGKNFVSLGFAHDHKRAFDNDLGLNTGGMGTYAPSPFIDEKIQKEIDEKIITPSLKGLENEGCAFKGVLFAGLMIGSKGIRLLEYNIRFGDPETQVILPRIKNDFIDLIEAAIAGNLNKIKIEFDQENKFICVVLAANGYPESYQKGSEINNLEKLNEADGAYALHAGTIKKDNKILANGGRVLNVVASAKTFKEARKKAYNCVDLINWKDGFCRRDIAKKVEDF